MVDPGDLISFRREPEFEEGCLAICDDAVAWEDHLAALEWLIIRARKQGVPIPHVPGTDVHVVRLYGRYTRGRDIPGTRVFLRFIADDGRVDLLWIEEVIEDEGGLDELE